MQSLIGLVCGLVFGAGLAISGMTNPQKVLNFLDVFGHWDPTLLVVMGGAVVIAILGFSIAGIQERPWLAERFRFPEATEIDVRLITGATLFGVGWGLVGLCPGPAIANLGRGSFEILLFVGAMALGMVVQDFRTRRQS